MPSHVSITDPNIHEPKGVAAAGVGEVYVADGATSGAWTQMPSGWGLYHDAAAAQAFNTTASPLAIDGLGAKTETSYLPLAIRGVSQIWSTGDGAIVPIALGDVYLVRVDLPITSVTGAKYITVSADVGGLATLSNIIIETHEEVDSTPPFPLSVVLSISANADFVTNGAQIFVATDAGSIDITAPSIHITRIHGEM